ncbi:MAG: 5-oxoprolinase subunit PxpB [Luminiphilus sp.]|nr:5-oxoprolinase subunit PxpB [Luminiphilus sp.]
MRWSYAGLTGIRLSYDDSPSPAVTASLLRLRDRLHTKYPKGLTDCVLGYRTLTLFFDPAALSRETLLAAIEALDDDLDAMSDFRQDSGQAVELPVWYAEESGQDLPAVAERSGLSVDAVIALHSSISYTAYATGFAPGFCYLGEVSEQLEMPRLRTPRRAVPPGSVAIADRQTAVYPSLSPGGWHLLGRCPLSLFDLEKSPPGLITVGDQVSFRPISRDEFLSLGGTL